MSAPKTKQKGLARLMGLLGQTQHPYRPATELFLDLDASQVAAELKLAERGSEMGAAGRPPQDAVTPDDIEHQAIDRIQAHQQDAHAIYMDQVQTYEQRLAALHFEEHFTTIQQAAPEAVGDFKAEAGLGRDELFGLRRKVLDAEKERDYFKEKHRLVRPARLPSQGKTILKIGLLAALFVLEVVINGSFLSKSNMQGLLGGAVQAVSFAALNIIVSFLAGLVPIRLINRRGPLKALGYLSLLAYLAFAVLLNLTLAHLREIPPSLAADIGQEVLTRLKTAPFALTDINSWVFVGIGFSFSVVAMADGLLYTDPYFGYGSVERRSVEAHANYTDGKSDLIERLREIKDSASETMNSAARDLSVRRGEYDAIIQARGRLDQRFAQHQNQIERTARTLLSVYRDANRAARKVRAPPCFDVPFVLERIAYKVGATDDSARNRLLNSITESQEILKTNVVAIQQAFDDAAKSYREIDDLIPEGYGGAPASQKA